MRRRKFIFAAGASSLLGTALSSFPKPAISSNTREINMVTSWPKNFPGLGTSAVRLGERITNMSGKKIKVNVHPRGSFITSSDSFSAVANGTAEMYHGIEYYWQKHSKALNFFASVPFGLTATEQSAWINFAGGQELWDKVSKNYGLKPFLAGNTGVQMGGWFNRQVTLATDFKDLRIRLPGFGGEVLRRLGAQAVSLPSSKIISAIQSGKLDATEWFGPWFDYEFGLHKITKYYYYPGFHEPGTSLSSAINLLVWDSLNIEEKSIIKTAMAAENDLVLAEFNAKNISALNLLMKNKRIKLRRFSDDIMNAIGKAAGEVVDEAGQTDALTKEVYFSFLKFRKNSIKWSKVSDQAYWNARLLPFPYGPKTNQ